MKAICICGSPNRNGSTATLLSELSRGMRDAGIDVALWYLNDLEIGYCLGCNACRDGMPCTQRDGMQALADALIAADIVCIGSPSYWGDVTAQLKTFFDRSTPLCDTCPGGSPIPSGKLGVSVAVRTGRNAAESLHLLDTIEHYFGHLGIRSAARLHAEGINTPADISPSLMQTAYTVGLGLPSQFSSQAETEHIALAEIAEPDIPEIARMNHELIQDEGSRNPMSIPELEQRLRDFLRSGYRGVVIRTEGHEAGYCLWRPDEGPNGGAAGVYLRQFFISRKHRRMGLGRAALQRIVKEYFTGTAFVALDVLGCNKPGQAFWADFGFRPDYTRMKLDL